MVYTGNTMDSRKQQLLRHIIEEYISSAQPVGSKRIADERMHEFSGATIRNEMQELVKEGYIMTPHTSAGRVPTEAGWRHYIEQNITASDVSEHDARELTMAYGSADEHETQVKQLLKSAAERTGETMVVAFAPNNVFYTGISHLFSKPEFQNHEQVVSLSEVIDHMDDVMSRLHTRIDDDISVLLGSDNPFGNNCASILTMAKIGNAAGVIGLLGPMRMDYRRNVAFMKFIKQLLERPKM